MKFPQGHYPKPIQWFTKYKKTTPIEVVEIHYLCSSLNHSPSKNNFFSSVASDAFILPARIKLNCFRLNAPS